MRDNKYSNNIKITNVFWKETFEFERYRKIVEGGTDNTCDTVTEYCKEYVKKCV